MSTRHRVIDAFPDLAAGTGECPRACTHLDEHCALPAFVADGGAGPAGPARLGSLRRVLTALTDDTA